MGDEVEVAVMKQTQEALGKVIKRPPLTEKLLKKPPFRFLHDIITNVIKNTGFMKDLYTGDELNPENIKDKEAKINFLQKAIDVVVIVTGDSLTVRPAKVVAGHEADKTNEFLQALAKATKKKEEGREAVQRVKNGLKPPKPSKKRDASRDKNKEASKEIKEKSDTREKSRRGSDDAKVSRKDRSSRDSKKPPLNKEGRSSKDKDSSKSSSKEKSQTSVRDKDRSRSKDQDVVSQNASGNIEPKPEETKSPSRKTSASPSHIREAEPVVEDTQDNNEETVALVNGDAADTAMTLPSDELQSSPQKVTSQGDSPSITSGTRPSTTRPGTGRPSGKRAPSVAGKQTPDTSKHQRRGLKRETSIETMANEEPPARPPTSMNRLRSARPSSARPPPPVVRSRRPVEEPAGIEPVNSVANVIVENEKDDEDNAFVVEEPSAPIAAEDFISTVPTTTAASTDLNVDSGQHGSLVAQILETKKDLEMGSQQTQLKHTEIDKSSMTDASRKKERDFVGREIDKMRSSIQTLTRSVNPLGKMIDYLQEDVDSMQKELEVWQKENLQHVQALKREQSNLEGSVEPLKAQLHELDQAIEDQLDKISSVKASILRNEEKIQKLLSHSKS